MMMALGPSSATWKQNSNFLLENFGISVIEENREYQNHVHMFP
jgi:hypothetical protein